MIVVRPLCFTLALLCAVGCADRRPSGDDDDATSDDDDTSGDDDTSDDDTSDDDDSADDDDSVGDDDTSVENTAPTVTILTPLAGSFHEEGVPLVLEGEGSDAQDGDLPGSALFWSSSLDGAWGSGSSVTIPSPSVGDHTLILSGIDSQGLDDIDVISFTVVGIGQDLPPTVTITAPPSGTPFTTADTVGLEAIANDAEDGSLATAGILWESDVQGALGAGSPLPTTLSAGLHQITARASDSAGQQGSASVFLPVTEPGNTAPTVQIATPTSGSFYASGATVTFQGSATDPEDGAIAGGSLAWSSSIDGALGTGSVLQSTTLSAGTHLITLLATDSQGAAGIDTTSILILAANTPPVATILTPNDGTSVVAGTSVAFSGQGTDAEDGNLSGASLLWQSQLDGTLGTGAAFSLASLSPGTHTITLTAVDSAGSPDSDDITLTVTPAAVNLPPAAILVGPGTAIAGSPASFDGSGSYDNDGSIVDYTFDFGDGSPSASGSADTVSHSYALAGTFTATLTVTDDEGATATAGVAVVVEEPVQVPVVVADWEDTFNGRCALVLEADDTPHVFARDATHAQLWHGWDDGASWSWELIDGPGFGVGGAVSTSFEARIDGAGTIHVAYAYTSGALGYATIASTGVVVESIPTTFTPSGSTLVGLALDPANGGRPTVGYTQAVGGGQDRPTVVYRTAPGSWTSSNWATATYDDNFLGHMDFTPSGTLWLGYGYYDAGAVPWSPAAGFGTAESLGDPDGGSEWPLVMVGGEPMMLGTDTLYDRAAGLWTGTAYENQAITHRAMTVDAAGTAVLAVRHGSDIEILLADPYWSYTYEGPMDSAWPDVAVDSTGLVRACFLRSQNVLVF